MKLTLDQIQHLFTEFCTETRDNIAESPHQTPAERKNPGTAVFDLKDVTTQFTEYVTEAYTIIRIRFVVQAPQPLVFVAEVGSMTEAMRLAKLLSEGLGWVVTHGVLVRDVHGTHLVKP
jgi:hypothetical protein